MTGSARTKPTDSGSRPAARIAASGAVPAPTIGVPALWEVFAVLLLCGSGALAVFVTYTRIPADELYRVGREGLAGGASRTLIVLNFPVALVALALLAITMARLRAQPWAAAPRRRVTLSAVALLAAVLCAVTVLPGVVTEDALDVRPVNALPALGLALVVALVGLTARVSGAGVWLPLSRRDWLPLALSGLFLFAAIPWIMADLGLFASDLPLLGRLFIAEQRLPAGAAEPAVHLGHHHGIDGVVFAVSGLVLTRALWQMSPSRLRAWVAAALALMIVYGTAIMLNDLWGEQVVKRGKSSIHIFSNVLWPAVSLDWAAVLVIAGLLTLWLQHLLRRWDQRPTPLR